MLEPMRVVIFKGGNPVRVVEIDDPRTKFCEAYNADCPDDERAVPAVAVQPDSSATRLASSRRLEV